MLGRTTTEVHRKMVTAFEEATHRTRIYSAVLE